MDFGINKCVVLVIKRDRMVKSVGIELPDGRRLRALGEDDDGYKYLNVLEADDVKQESMKERLSKEYIRRVNEVVKSKLSGENVVRAVNS